MPPCHVRELRIPLGGPDREEMTNKPECEAHEPKTQAEPDGGLHLLADGEERAHPEEVGEQDVLDEHRLRGQSQEVLQDFHDGSYLENEGRWFT